MEYEDYHDFEKKYGSDVNKENRNLRYAYWYLFDGLGFLLRKKLVDKDTMYAAISAGGSLWLWDKHESIIKEIRRRYNMPELGVNFEYLIEEHKKMMTQRGHSLEVPEFYGRYIENP